MLTWICCIYIHALKKKNHMRYYYSKIYMNFKSISRYFRKQYFRFSQRCCMWLKFSEMWSCAILPIVPICLNDHSVFFFRAKQHKSKILLGLLDQRTKTLQSFNTLGTTCHRHSVAFHKFWTFFLTCTSQNILYYQKNGQLCHQCVCIIQKDYI